MTEPNNIMIGAMKYPKPMLMIFIMTLTIFFLSVALSLLISLFIFKRYEVGAYKVTLGIQEDATVHREITVFVVDDATVTDKETLLFGQDFELTPGEKRNLNAEKVKAVTKVRAYDIQSGAEITKEVKTNTQDLMHYLQEDEKAVTQRFSVRGITLEVKASTLLPSEQSTHGTTGGEDGTFVSGGKLPSTGESNNLLAMMGIALLTLLSLLLVHHKGLIKRKNEGGV